MYIIGIDPGKNGALAVISQDGEIWGIKPFNIVEYRDALAHFSHCSETVVAAVEKVGAMPQQGVTSTFSFGHNAGMIEGMLIAFEIPYQLVTPQRWKKEFALLKRDKKASIAEAHRLFPMANLRQSAKCRTDNDGMADALLMAEWGRRMYHGVRI